LKKQNTIAKQTLAGPRRAAVMGLAALIVLVTGVMSLSLLFAQDLSEPSFGRVKDFFVPDYYDPPNQNQMKSLLRGAEAQPQANGRVLIKELQLETYREDGKTEMIVRAQECTYDQGKQTASSASRIEARSGDGKLTIEGEGFLWQQTNSLFTISNRVHTTIRQALAKAE
jgi:hypothetical protein